MLVAFTSLKASPGVTTAVLALAAAVRRRAGVLVADCDPAGGDVALRLDLPVEPGVITLAAASRDGHVDALAVNQHVQPLPSGVQVMPGPPGMGQAAVALATLTPIEPHPLVAAARQHGRLVLADVGRLTTGTPARPLIRAADEAVLVLRPRWEEVTHAAARMPEIMDQARRWSLLLIGRGRYQAEEVASSLALPLAGVLPADRTGAAVVGQAVTGQWVAVRARLIREAQRVVVNLDVPVPADDVAPVRTRRQRRRRMRALADEHGMRP